MIKVYHVTVRSSAVRDVEFTCPRCADERIGTLVEQRNFGMVGVVPVVPLEQLEQRVQCHTCGYLAGLGVLEILSERVLLGCLAVAMRQSIATVVRAGAPSSGTIDEDVVDEAIDTMVMAGYEYSEPNLAADLVRTTPQSLRDALHPLVAELTIHGKLSFMHRMLNVALVTGQLTRKQQRALVDIGVGLGLPAAEVNQTLASASSPFLVAA